MRKGRSRGSLYYVQCGGRAAARQGRLGRGGGSVAAPAAGLGQDRVRPAAPSNISSLRQATPPTHFFSCQDAGRRGPDVGPARLSRTVSFLSLSSPERLRQKLLPSFLLSLSFLVALLRLARLCFSVNNKRGFVTKIPATRKLCDKQRNTLCIELTPGGEKAAVEAAASASTAAVGTRRHNRERGRRTRERHEAEANALSPPCFLPSFLPSLTHSLSVGFASLILIISTSSSFSWASHFSVYPARPNDLAILRPVSPMLHNN